MGCGDYLAMSDVLYDIIHLTLLDNLHTYTVIYVIDSTADYSMSADCTSHHLRTGYHDY